MKPTLMKTVDRIADTARKTGATAASLIKAVLQSRRCTARRETDGGEIIILGNGPSLRDTIDNHSGRLKELELMAVNFAANAPDFEQLRPSRYILADPHFFNGADTDPNVGSLWKKLGTTSWPMRLYVPVKFRRRAEEMLGNTHRVRISTFNLTPLEGFKAPVHALYRCGAGMPRPRNVLIPAIMCALRAGFRTIYIAGADHSWTRTLDVDDNNCVVSIQPHFYEDSESEKKRVSHEYKGYRLHQILESLTIAFRSYFAIRDYAASIGAEIINVTPGSFIDAFPRGKL